MVLTHGYALACLGSLIALGWEAQDKREELSAFLALSAVAVLHASLAILSLLQWQCGYAFVANLLTTVHVVGSALDRAATGRGWEAGYRWRWNLRSMVGVAISWTALAYCLGTI